MKVLFLDIDGVLITRASAYYYHWLGQAKSEGWRTFCPVASNNLRVLLKDIPELKIVLSSSWRGSMSLVECQEFLTGQGIDGTRCIGRTGPHLDRRGFEIQAWLDQYPECKQFVILDDDSDMEHLAHRLVKTDFSVGLTLLHNDKIKEMLADAVLQN